MRYSIIAAPRVGLIGTIGSHDQVVDHIADRWADGQAFPGERLVRLPRRMNRRLRVNARYPNLVRRIIGGGA